MIKLFTILDDSSNDSSSLMVVCKQCRNNAFKAIKKEINSKEIQMSKDKKVDEIIKKMETLSKTVESNMVKLEAIGSLNETLHATIDKALEKMKATYAEMLRDKQDNVTKHLEINKVALKDSMKLALLESQMEQNKGSTLILYNCPEKIIREHEKNKNRQDKSLYYVVRGLPSKLEIKAVPARDEAEETDGQLQREEDE